MATARNTLINMINCVQLETIKDYKLTSVSKHLLLYFSQNLKVITWQPAKYLSFSVDMINYVQLHTIENYKLTYVYKLTNMNQLKDVFKRPMYTPYTHQISSRSVK
jgi:hypothetical protein